MRAQIPELRTATPSDAEALRRQPGAVRESLTPLLHLAEYSDSLIAGSVGDFIAGGRQFRIPRFIFLGPKGGGDTIRLAIFAGFHGDETEDTEALVRFLLDLEQSPEAARNYHIYAYPICNPSGLVHGSHNNGNGEDLTRQFWRGSVQQEIYYLEREMGVHRFQGVVSLHGQDTTPRFLVHSRSSILDAAVAKPAVEAAHKFLPGLLQAEAAHSGPTERSHAARNDFLTATGELQPAPFEIHLGLPRRAPRPSRIYGAVGALKSILESYRTLQGLRQNI